MRVMMLVLAVLFLFTSLLMGGVALSLIATGAVAVALVKVCEAGNG